MRLSWRFFNGIIPKVSTRNLPDANAQTAQNVFLAEYDLQPIKAPLQIATLPDALRQSIYLWRRNSTTEWLSWTTDVDVVRGPIADDQYSRIYYTDGTTLHMKLWNGAKVEVSDVSIAAPSAPTITKTVLFNPSNITATEQGAACTLTGYSWNGSILKLTFYVPTHAVNNSNINLPFRITIPTYGSTPTGATDPRADIFDDKVTITGVGVFQVTDINNTNYVSTPTPASGWTVPYDKVVTINMNYSRTSTQYQYYVQTTVDQYGQESPPSDPSAQVEWGPNDALTVQAASGGTKVRLYRSATGTTESKFYFVAEVAPGATYADSLTDAQLSETLPLIENPPTAMSGLVSMPGGFLAAFNGKDVYFSEPFLPYSWPTRYRLTMDYDVVGLATIGNDLIVLTTGNPYYISGTHPDIMSQTKLPVEQSCVAKRSIAYADKFVVYASPDGLVSIAGGQVSVITSKFYTRDQWQALTPANLIGAVHDQRYVGFFTTGGIIFDFKEPNSTLSTTDESATGLYSDLEDDALYMIQTSNITSWRAGATYLLATWKSKEFQNVQDAIFDSALVIADSYASVTFKIFASGVQVWSYAVTSDAGFRVPTLDRDTRWSIQLETTDKIVECVVASEMTLLRAMEAIK